MGVLSWFSKLIKGGNKVSTVSGASARVQWSKGFADGVKYASAKVGTAAKSVVKTAEPVAAAAAKGGRTLISWGTAAKASLVAFGGVLAYKWFGSGIPAFFADIFKTDEQTGSYIAIAVFSIIFLVLIYCVIGWFRGRGADFGDGKSKKSAKGKKGGRV